MGRMPMPRFRPTIPQRMTREARIVMTSVAGRGRSVPLPQSRRREAKEPFNIDRAIVLLRQAVRPFAPAAMFALKDAGFGTLFQQLVACIISIRTRDEVSLPVSLALL